MVGFGNFIFWTSFVGNFLLAINVIICLVRWKELTTTLRWLTAYLGNALVIQIIAKIFWAYTVNNLPLLHLYTLLEFILLSLFYYSLYYRAKFKYFRYYIIFGGVFILFNSLFIQPLESFNSIAKTFTQLSYILLAIGYMFSLAKGGVKKYDLINSAILIYYSASLFIFMFSNVMLSLEDATAYNLYLWAANVFLDILFQLMILYSLWSTVWRQTRSSP